MSGSGKRKQTTKAKSKTQMTTGKQTRNVARKKKVAILGGGMAGLTAAYALTRGPLADQYEVTIYTQGWRLGGKGASGRNPNAVDTPGRIEEHGLHFLFGFYENAFRIIRRCYEALGRDWKDVFVRNDQPLTMYETVNQHLEPWTIMWPTIPGVPGERDTDPEDFSDTVRGSITRLVRWLHSLFREEQLHGDQVLMQSAEDALRIVTSDQPLAAEFRRTEAQSLETLFARMIAHLPGQSRRIRVLGGMMLSVGLGVVRDVVLGGQEWFALDRWDLREWLRRHAASEEVANSAPVDGLYSAVFSAGIPVGAGTMVHALLRATFFAKGASFYRMKQGMGDAIFVPLYEALEKHVKFEFFHRITDLHHENNEITEVAFDLQAEVLAGPAYDPLIPSRQGVRCWPVAPKWELLAPGTEQDVNFEDWWSGGKPASQGTLRLGKDFDTVILAMSVGALPFACQSLVDDPWNPAFGAMVRGVSTTQTQAAQLTFKTPPQLPSPTIIPFVQPLDTVADMSHLREAEQWPESVAALVYVCGPLADTEAIPRVDPQYSERQRARVLEHLRTWLTTPARQLGQGFELAGLSVPLEQQHYCATTHPSDRYVLAAAGTHRYRLDAHQSGYRNLALAGDWTRNALSLGCLESATMSGIRAAQAVEPKVPPAYGDWLAAPVPLSTVTPPERTIAPAPRPFILRDGDVLAVPPIGLDVQLSMFLLKADLGALQRLCDRHLNFGEYRYEPLWPYVTFYSSTMDNIVDGMGHCPEGDSGFWLPVLRGSAEKGPFKAERLLTYTPYLWVDNDVALVGGREVFGFPKHLARLEGAGSHRAPNKRTVHAQTLDTLGANSVVKEGKILELTGTPSERPTDTLSGWGAVVRAIQDLVHLRGRVLPPVIWKAVTDGGMAVAFLKQAPHSVLPHMASHRSIIEAIIGIDGTPHVGVIESAQPYKLDIYRYASHEIVHRLGLEATPNGPGKDTVTAVMQGWMEFKATVGPAELERETLR